ncbi:hypothetical protein VTG60DRAFT_4149 [Thermothelomyces hinnuleus]
MSPELEEKIELQVGFQRVLDDALRLLSTRELHGNSILVDLAVSLVERAVRWGIYMEDSRTSQIDARRFLRGHRATLARIEESLSQASADAEALPCYRTPF